MSLSRRTRDTGPDRDTRELVLARAAWRCERCGQGIHGPAGYSLQHRCARQMGGTAAAWVNDPSNLAVLCGSATTACHGEVERRRRVDQVEGWWLERWQTPSEWPVLLFTGEWVLLAGSGLYIPSDPPSFWRRDLREGVS